MVVQVLMIGKGELATSVKKKSQNEIHQLGRCWEQQTTSLIAFIFGMLVNVGKKIMCLQCGLKVDVSREILTVVMMLYYKNVHSCKRHSSSLHILFLAIHFSLSWPCDSLP